jgi:hypothetical protein
LEFAADDAVRYNDGYALVARNRLGRPLPPDLRDRLFELLVSYNDIQQ